jgi:hypothetical protein
MLYSWTTPPPLMNRQFVEASISKIDLLMSGQMIRWCMTKSRRGAPNDFKQAKYEHYVKRLAARMPIEMPEVCQLGQGIDIVDGRHRLYALWDSGYTRVRVFCQTNEAARIKQLVG